MSTALLQTFVLHPESALQKHVQFITYINIGCMYLAHLKQLKVQEVTTFSSPYDWIYNNWMNILKCSQSFCEWVSASCLVVHNRLHLMQKIPTYNNWMNVCKCSQSLCKWVTVGCLLVHNKFYLKKKNTKCTVIDVFKCCQSLCG